HSVAVLEQGRREDPQTFEHNELSMFARMYKQSGLQTSEDHNMALIQGATLGGSTVINNAIWMRADLDRVIPTWESAGAPVDRRAVEAGYEELEQALHVSPVPPDLANRGTDVFLRGCDQIGIRGELLHNNRNHCIGCGWCNYGCRYNRKTSMLVTYIPWAESRGVEFLDCCDDTRVLTRDGLAVGVEANRHGKRVAIEAERVVVCAGAIGSSAVLLRSGVDLDGRVGQGLHVLGGTFVTGETHEDIDGYDGIGLTSVAHADPDYVIESYFAPPVAFSLRLGGFFLSHFDRTSRYRHFVDGGVMVGTDPRNGRVRLDRKGNVRIEIKFGERDLSRLRRGLATISRIYFAGGAVKVFPSSFKMIEFSHPDQVGEIEQMIREPDDLTLGSAHPQGGNPMSADRSRGVVDPEFRVHGFENLFVADTSVWPENIWANCQATAMAMSHYAATFVAA
ncbi:MAG TPA: GMC family oxidoreductase, partial [Solirubrobacterales bacterium]|nr:GMC family oxidoreductase [Solirubrobacterales bacterium]